VGYQVKEQKTEVRRQKTDNRVAGHQDLGIEVGIEKDYKGPLGGNEQLAAVSQSIPVCKL
jgi:hypothetical protein